MIDYEKQTSKKLLLEPLLSLLGGFPGDWVIKNLPANAGDMGSIPGLGRSPGEEKWQPTPVFLLGKSHGERSLVGYSPWSHKGVRHDLGAKQQQYPSIHIQVSLTTWM